MRAKLCNGFTLVELLVVMGIITLLIGLLMPAMSSAREQSKSVQCLSNLRQMGILTHAYIVANGGHYPLATYNADNWDFSFVSGKVVPGLLWGGRGDAKIQQCPSWDGKSSPGTLFTGYNYNTSYLGGELQGTKFRPSAKASQVRQPSRTAIFGDGEYAAGTNRYMRAPFFTAADSNVARWAGTQGFRHRRRTNVCFCDGHAESLIERFTQKDPKDSGVVAPRTGFLSADNSLYDLE
ncbi:MAG TPA: prepilin-type N-terminal cleavage/methylation domain-containing protein [Tepidisphaeraceae bacterium]|jgi:prepilin-type processing-associated H-X9-DG protein/prepilin-type N-terminal cleavage/methylation domain-containing protein